MIFFKLEGKNHIPCVTRLNDVPLQRDSQFLNPYTCGFDFIQKDDFCKCNKNLDINHTGLSWVLSLMNHGVIKKKKTQVARSCLCSVLQAESPHSDLHPAGQLQHIAGSLVVPCPVSLTTGGPLGMYLGASLGPIQRS